MMQRLGGLWTATLAVTTGLAITGCEPATEADIGTIDQAVLCGPQLDGAYPMLATLAITVGNELRRFEATTDFVYSNNRVRLSSAALTRCDLLGLPGCENVRAVLDMQNARLIEVNGKRLFDPVQYQQQLKVYLERQKIAEDRPCRQADSAWCAKHTLTLDHIAPGVCALDYWYQIHVGTCFGVQCDPTRIKTKLIFAGYPENGYLHPTFDLTVSPPQVGIDPPVFSMVEGGTVPLVNGCVDAIVVYDPPHEHLGACCLADGVPGTLVESSWNTDTLDCQTE